MASEPIEIEPMVWDAVEMERWATTVPTVHGADGSRFTVHGSRVTGHGAWLNFLAGRRVAA